MLNLTVTCSYILYCQYWKEKEEKPVTHYNYRCELVDALINYHSTNNQTEITPARLRRATKLSQELNENIADWVPYLLKRSDKLQSFEYTPQIHKPIYMNKQRFHHLAEIQTPLRGQLIVNTNSQDWTWRPKCVARGCDSATSKCCIVCHVPLFVKCFGKFHYDWEIGKYIKNPK